MSDLEQPKPSGISRRTVAKAMAWSVPAVALAVPAPAYAASCIPTVSLGSDSCKCPGASQNEVKAYYLEFVVGGENCAGATGTVTITEVNYTTAGGGPLNPLGGDPYPIVIPVGGSSPTIGFDGSGNSANFIEVVYSINDGPSQSVLLATNDLEDCTAEQGYCND